MKIIHISLQGHGGVGKSHSAVLLAQYLQSKGGNVLTTAPAASGTKPKAK